MRFNSEPVENNSGDQCPVYFSAKNPETARILLRHYVSTKEIQSPVPEIAGKLTDLDGLTATAQRMNDLWPQNMPIFFYDVPTDGGVVCDPTFIKLINGHSSNPLESSLIVNALKQHTAEFAGIILSDHEKFYGDSYVAPQSISVEVRFERQSQNILDHWTPGGHLDGIKNGKWDVAYIITMGEPTIHFAGVQAGATKDYGNHLDHAGMSQVRLQPGEVARIFRTSFHAPPIRYEGHRLVFITRRLNWDTRTDV